MSEKAEKKSKPKAAPKPKRRVMIGPAKVSRMLVKGYALDKEYVGKTHRERVNLANGDPVPMLAPE